MRFVRTTVALAVLAAAAFALDGPTALELRDATGAQHSLADYRGKIVVLNFWATWCLPCKYEMPMLVDLQSRYPDRVVVIGASLDDKETQKRIPKFVARHKVQFPVWIGADTGTLTRFGMGNALPATVFLDKDGNVVGRVLGELKKSDLFPRIEWMLGERDGPPPKPLVKNLD
jgi:thiol-disulfide isomerase/thioredoxin